MVVYHGTFSKFFDPAACGRGGSWTGQNGLVVIELLPLAAALDAAVSSPSASPSGEPMRISPAPPTSMPTTSATARTANHQSVASLLLLILLPMALCAALCTCCVLRFGCYYFTGQTNSKTAIAISSRLQLVSTSPSSSANTSIPGAMAVACPIETPADLPAYTMVETQLLEEGDGGQSGCTVGSIGIVHASLLVKEY